VTKEKNRFARKKVLSRTIVGNQPKPEEQKDTNLQKKETSLKKASARGGGNR